MWMFLRGRVRLRPETFINLHLVKYFTTNGELKRNDLITINQASWDVSVEFIANCHWCTLGLSFNLTLKLSSAVSDGIIAIFNNFHTSLDVWMKLVSDHNCYQETAASYKTCQLNLTHWQFNFIQFSLWLGVFTEAINKNLTL